MKNETRKSVHKVISNLKKVKKMQSKIRYWFIKYSFTWIKNRANKLLNQRTNGYKSSNARSWEIKIYDTYGLLKNLDPNSGAIEFGIGVKGQQGTNVKAKNDVRIVANENGYKYNMLSDSKDESGGWSFYLPDGTYIYTHGYGGKSFLYDALMEYKQKDIAIKMYKKAFDKIMGGSFKQ